jgi:ABC-2 type transport system ATP-binding protein
VKIHKRLANEEKITIILTTYYMEEADILCNRIGFIDKGKIIALNTPLKLKEGLGGEIINIKFDNNGMIENKKIIRPITEFGFTHRIEKNENIGEIVIYVDNANLNLPVILKYLHKETIPTFHRWILKGLH